MEFIIVDPSLDPDDYESSGINTTTQSLTSSVNEYFYENGRRYHIYFGADKNLLPTDEIEQDRMDIHHEIMLKLLDDELYLAPITNPQRILDIGTGTGIWAIDMADKFPAAEVIGTDLSPIQPKWVPPNCKFEVDDAELDWMYPRNYFDMIHARNVAQAIRNWPKLMSEMYRATVPGGYVELAETGGEVFSDDNTMADDNPVKVYFDKMRSGMEAAGRPFQDRESLTDKLERAGFVDIEAVRIRQPLAPWPLDKKLKEIGVMALFANVTAFHAYGMAVFTRVLGLSSEEADGFCRRGSIAVKNPRLHVYLYFYVAYGRKPTTSF